jgi:hypothetical protein
MQAGHVARFRAERVRSGQRNRFLDPDRGEIEPRLIGLNAPVLAADRGDARELGQSLRECLAVSSEGVPQPKSFTNLFDPVLNLADVRSSNTFVKSAKCVEVELEGETAALIPTRNEGAEDGFAPLPEKAQVAGSEGESWGSAAVAALALAE